MENKTVVGSREQGDRTGDGKLKRPPLPRVFHTLNMWSTTLYLAHALLFFLLPVVGIFQVMATDWPFWARLAVGVFLGMIAGHGMHLMTFVGHEGLHTNLHRNKYVSAALALVWTMAVPMFFIVGYSVTHWKHHRFSGKKPDPDAQIFSNYRNFISRFFLGRSKGVRIYTQNAVRLALGMTMPDPIKLPFTEKEMRTLARANILLGMVGLSAHVYLTVVNPLVGVLVTGVPYLSLYVFTCFRAYVEHAGTTPGAFTDARSYTSPFYSALFYGGNFHLEHHLYPAVPSYRLGALHRYLKEQGLFEQAGAHVDTSILGPVRYTTSQYQYPFYENDWAPDEYLESVASGNIERSSRSPDLAAAVAGATQST
jgi:fatty acid desaturase